MNYNIFLLRDANNSRYTVQEKMKYKMEGVNQTRSTLSFHQTKHRDSKLHYCINCNLNQKVEVHTMRPCSMA